MDNTIHWRLNTFKRKISLMLKQNQWLQTCDLEPMVWERFLRKSWGFVLTGDFVSGQTLMYFFKLLPGNFTLLYRRLLKRAKIEISHLAGKDLRWCLCLNASAAVKAAALAGKTMFVAFCFIVFYQATFYSQFGFGIWLHCQLATPASENVFQASIDSWNNFDRVWPWPRKKD